MFPQLNFNPIPPLLSSSNEVLRFFTRRDLLGDNPGSIETLWQLPEAKKIFNRQQADGSWKYPGGGRHHLRSTEDYNQLETYRNFGVLIEKYGLDRRHPAIQRAAEYLFSCQTEEGDFRGIYGMQYTPNYSAAIMELLIKAGYSTDVRTEKGFQWLLSIRQQDGGWAIPLRTVGKKFDLETMQSELIQPDKTKPFSHLVTGIVLRAFTAHPEYRKSNEARTAGKLLASRFFTSDKYPDRQGASYWSAFSFPFWNTDLLSALDSLSLMIFTSEEPQIQRAFEWFTTRQCKDGLWELSLLRGKDKDTPLWISLAICRVFKAGNVP